MSLDAPQPGKKAFTHPPSVRSWFSRAIHCYHRRPMRASTFLRCAGLAAFALLLTPTRVLGESDAPPLPPDTASASPKAAASAPAKAAPAPAKPKGNKASVLTVSFAQADNASIQAAQVASIIESVVQRSTTHESTDAQSKFDPAGTETRRDKVQKGDEALAFGIKQYGALEEGLGLEAFERAITAYEESPLWAGEKPGDNFRKLTKALVMRILVKWAEDPGSTRKELRRVLTMDPKADFPKEWTPPDLTAEAQRIRDAVPYEVPVSLDIASDPPANVYIDGVYRGIAPMSVRSLNPGEHYLSMFTPGYEVVQRIVKAEPGATITETLKPTGKGNAFISFVKQIKQQFHKDDEITRAKFLGVASGSQQVIIANVSRASGQVALDMHRILVSTGSVLKEVRNVKFPTTEKEMKEVVTSRVLDLLKDNGNCAQEICKFMGDGPVPTTPVIKTVLGVTAAVTLATGIGVGLAAASKDSDYRKMAQNDPALSSTGSSVRTQAIVADTLMGVGLVTGVIWAYMQFKAPYVERTDSLIQDAPVQEKQRPIEKKEPEKKKPPEDDPFASTEPAPTPWTSRATTLFASPIPNGLTFGVQGAF